MSYLYLALFWVGMSVIVLLAAAAIQADNQRDHDDHDSPPL